LIVQLSRFVFTVAGALAGIAVSKLVDWAAQLGVSALLVIIVFIILGSAIGYLLGGIIGRELARAFALVEERVREYATTDIILAVAGLLVGLLVALILSQPLHLVLKDTTWAFLGTLLVFGLCAYAGVRVAMLKSPSFRHAFNRLNAGELELAADDTTASGTSAASVKYLDTSAVIDGRFVELREAGLLEGVLRVPRFVLVELQTLADSADDIKRARGRRGLDLLETLTGQQHVVEVFEIDYDEIADVDHKLLRLVADAGGAMVTVDANLTKVARVQGQRVVNLNEIATAMRPSFLPGEALRLLIVKEGKEAGQGVGYLEDGTMVVVAEARAHVGREADTVVTSVLQTSVGKMVFARLKAAS
jgi:uncharacterized protein YacL